MEVAKALGGSFKLVTLVPKTVREMTQLPKETEYKYKYKIKTYNAPYVTRVIRRRGKEWGYKQIKKDR